MAGFRRLINLGFTRGRPNIDSTPLLCLMDVMGILVAGSTDGRTKLLEDGRDAEFLVDGSLGSAMAFGTLHHYNCVLHVLSF